MKINSLLDINNGEGSKITENIKTDKPGIENIIISHNLDQYDYERYFSRSRLYNLIIGYYHMYTYNISIIISYENSIKILM